MNRFTFDGFEGYAAGIEKAQLKLTLPGGDSPGWMVGHLDIGGLLLQVGRGPKRYLAEGYTNPGGISLYFPLLNPAALRANGKLMDNTKVQAIGPEAEFCHYYSMPNMEWYAITVPCNLLTARGFDSEHNLLRVFNHSARFLRPEAVDLARLKSLVDRVVRFSTRFDSSVLAAPAVRRQIAAEIFDLATRMMTTALPEPTSTVGRRTLNRKQIIRAAMEQLERGVDQEISVFELTTAAGVSERTLRTAFQEYFGISPKCYLKLRRLHQARAALQATNSTKTTVTEIATQYGFWELGRFSCEYRRLFGEYPSETLRARRCVE